MDVELEGAWELSDEEAASDAAVVAAGAGVDAAGVDAAGVDADVVAAGAGVDAVGAAADGVWELSDSDDGVEAQCRGRGRGRGRGLRKGVRGHHIAAASTALSSLRARLRGVASPVRRPAEQCQCLSLISQAGTAASGVVSKLIFSDPVLLQSHQAEVGEQLDVMFKAGKCGNMRTALRALPCMANQTKFSFKNLHLAAASVHFGGVLWVAAALRRLVAGMSAQCRVVAMCVQTVYDEAPMKIRIRADPGRVHVDALENGSAIPEVKETAAGCASQNSLAKVFQMEAVLRVLVEEEQGDEVRYCLHEFPVCSPLLVGDRMTGETIAALVKENSFVPGLADLMRQPEVLAFGCTTADRAECNGRAEDGLYFSDPTCPRCRLPCSCHICATVQGRVFSIVSGDISGSIATCIVWGHAGNVQKFREALQQEILQRAKVCSQNGYSGDDPRHVRKLCLLDTLLPLPGTSWQQTNTVAAKPAATCQVAHRRSLLLQTFSGDWSNTEEIVVFAGSPAAAAGVDVTQLAELGAQVLFPCCISFQRNGVTRWCNTPSPLRAFSLLGCVHGLLRPALQRFLAGIGVAIGPAPSAAVVADEWELSDDDDVCAGGELVEHADPIKVAEAVAVKPAQKDVLDFNQKQRGKAKVFAQTVCPGRLLISVICLSLSVWALHRVEHFSSTKWAVRNELNMQNGQPYSCRVLAAHRGEIHAGAITCGMRLVDDPSMWTSLSGAMCTWGLAGLAFAQISTFFCGMEQLQWSVWRGWPYRLWMLLDHDEIAEELLGLPSCMLDEFSLRFRQIFSTVSALLSSRCRAVLIMLGDSLVLDISHIESRNAQIRRFCQSSETWWTQLLQVSSHFVLQRARIRVSSRPDCVKELRCRSTDTPKHKRRRQFKPRKRKKAKCKSDADGRRKYIGKRRDGGGAYRACLSKLLTEQPVLPCLSQNVKGDRFRAMAATYQRWKATNSEEYQECVQNGARGRKRHRSGGKAFGKAPSVLRKAERQCKLQRSLRSVFTAGVPRSDANVDTRAVVVAEKRGCRRLHLQTRMPCWRIRIRNFQAMSLRRVPLKMLRCWPQSMALIPVFGIHRSGTLLLRCFPMLVNHKLVVVGLVACQSRLLLC